MNVALRVGAGLNSGMSAKKVGPHGHRGSNRIYLMHIHKEN